MENKFKAFDYVIVALILILSLIVGLFHEIKLKVLNSKYFKRYTSKNQDENIELKQVSDQNDNKTSDYLTGNASISPIPIAFSLLASFFSATALLGMPAEVYQYGIQYWVHVFGMMLTPVNFVAKILIKESLNFSTKVLLKSVIVLFVISK